MYCTCALQTKREQSPTRLWLLLPPVRLPFGTSTTCMWNVNTIPTAKAAVIGVYLNVFFMIIIINIVGVRYESVFPSRAWANKSIAGERVILIAATNHWLYWPWSFATIDWRVQCNQLISWRLRVMNHCMLMRSLCILLALVLRYAGSFAENGTVQSKDSLFQLLLCSRCFEMRVRSSIVFTSYSVIPVWRLWLDIWDSQAILVSNSAKWALTCEEEWRVWGFR